MSRCGEQAKRGQAIRSAGGVSRRFAGVITRRRPIKMGKDAATFARLDAETGRDNDRPTSRPHRPAADAVAYMASGDILLPHPGRRRTSSAACGRAKHVVTPSLYSHATPLRSAPQERVDRLTQAAEEGGATPCSSAAWTRAGAMTHWRSSPPGRAPASGPFGSGDLRLLDV